LRWRGRLRGEKRIRAIDLIALADWTQSGMFWVTTVYAAITLAALAVNYLLLRSLNDPNVIVYARADDARRQMIMVVIQNIGKTVAKNIRFTLSEPLPVHNHAGGPPVPVSSGPLMNGIQPSPLGNLGCSSGGMFLDMWPLIGDRTFTVTARYDANTIGWYRSDEFETISTLELASFSTTDAVDTDGARQSEAELKRIADALIAEFERRSQLDDS
jgi:hypothetical protein